MNPQKPPTPEEDVQMARAAYAQGNLKHAINHLSYALTANPVHPEWRVLLDEIIAASPDPLNQLVPMEQNMHYAPVAIRAYIYAQQKEYRDAFPLMAQILNAINYPTYLPWISEWFLDFDALKKCSVDAILQILARLLSRIPGDTIPDPKLKEGVEALEPALDKLLEWYPSQNQLVATIAAFIRKLGHHEKAIRLSEQAYGREPNYYNGLMVALAYRAAGQIDTALDKYTQAISHDPENIDARLDMGDMLRSAKRYHEALDKYEEVLQRQEKHAWAFPPAIFCRFMLSKDLKFYYELWDYVMANPQLQHAYQLASSLGQNFFPYERFLPRPSEAVINVAMQLFQRGLQPGTKSTMNIGFSALESPSAVLSVERVLNEVIGSDFKLAITVDKIARPDPRYPLMPNLPYVLWDYEETSPKPRLPEPEKWIAEAIAELSWQGFEIKEWTEKASEIAKRVGAENVEQLLRVMLHPPQPKEGRANWFTTHRAIIAAALVIAQIDSGWRDSVRRKVLNSLLFGPMDWTTEAAIVALMTIAQNTQEAAEDIGMSFETLWECRPDVGYIPYQFALVKCGLRLPNIPPRFEKILLDADKYYQSNAQL